MDRADNDFDQFKQQTLQKLQKGLQEGLVDEKVKDILRLINVQEAYVTTSSCAGRIILIQLPQVGDKKKAVFLGRWHDPVSYEKLKSSISCYESGQLWLIAQSPIFHVAAKTLHDADALLKMGVFAGFKHSGMKTEKPRIMVELCSTERMDVPLAKNNQQFFTDDYLEFLIGIANDLLNRSQQKLIRLHKNLQKKERNK